MLENFLGDGGRATLTSPPFFIISCFRIAFFQWQMQLYQFVVHKPKIKATPFSVFYLPDVVSFAISTARCL